MNLPLIRGAAVFTAYLLTIPAANWLITEYGAVPVGFGLVAPAGVYAVGLALVLRDLVRETLGVSAVLCAIGLGAWLSWFLASPLLAMASSMAFFLSELLDFAVYEPLRQRGLLVAMGASNLVGMVADSLLFLWLAFGSLAFLPGQLVGKAWMTVAALAVIALVQQRRARTAVA